jgi:hypothetical protein
MPIGFIGPALQGARLIGGAAQLGRYALGLGSLLGAGLTGSAAQKTPRVGSIPPRDKTGESYRDAELRLSAAARAIGSPAPYASVGSGSSFESPAAERAYQQESSRVAQLTAQDPELQRYEAARKIAAGPNATPAQVQSAEDIGMQMWAKANPTLAAKVKPGQAGYEAIQGFRAGEAARAGLGFTTPQQLAPTPTLGAGAPQGLPQVSSFAPTQTYGAQGISVDPELIKKFQGLLNQAKT